MVSKYRSWRRSCIPLWAAVLLCAADAFVPAARAADVTWTGGGANNKWTTTSNWNAALVATDRPIFAGSTQTTTDNDFAADTSFAGIRFDASASAFTLAGNRITLGGNIDFTGGPATAVTQTINVGMVLSGNRTITTQANGTIVVGGTIGESGGARSLDKSGNGELRLSGLNNFSGQIRVNQGTLTANTIANAGSASSLGTGGGTSLIRLGNGSSAGNLVYIGTAAASTDRQIQIGNHTTVGGGGAQIANDAANAAHTLTFTASTFNAADAAAVNARTLTLRGANTGANTISGVIQDNTGVGSAVSLTKSEAGAWTLSGANTFSGGSTLSAGTLNINNAGSGGTSSAIGTGTLTLTGGTIDNTSGSALTLSTANTVSLNGNFAFGGSNNLSFANGTSTMAASRTVTLNGTGKTLTLGTLTASAATANLTVNEAGTANKLVLGGLVLAETDQARTRTIAGSANVDITGAVTDGAGTGADGLIKDGTGVLTLSGANTYTGNTRLDNGTLRVLVGSNIGSTGNLTVNAGTLDLQNTQSMAGTTVVVSGSVIQNGNYTTTSAADGAFRLGTGADGRWTVQSGKLEAVSMGNTSNVVNIGFGDGSSGMLDINGGTAYFRRIQLGRSSGTSTGTLKLQAGTLALTSLQSANDLGTYSFELSGGTLRPYDGTLTIGNTTASLNDFGFTLTGSNATIAHNNATTGARNSVLIYSAITESGGRQGLTFAGDSTGTAISLYGDNTYTGETTLSGTVQLRLMHANALGGTTLNFTGPSTVPFDESVTGNAFTFGGLKGNKNFGLVNNATTPAPIALSVGANNQSTSFTGIMSGSGSLRKIGSGTFTLTNAQAFTGATAIDAGTLQVNGSLSASSALTVASAATLAGSGTIGGLVTVLGGGIVAPGTSPGTLTMNAGLLLDATSLLAFELSSTNFTVGSGINDLIVVNGNFTLDGLLDVSAIGGGDFSAVPDNTTWRLFNYAGGTFTNNGLTLNSLPSPGGGRSFQIDTSTVGQVNLVLAVPVPEPATAVGAGIGLVTLALVVRRRQSAAARR